MATIRENLVRCIDAGGTSDEVARRICGMLSCECSLDNGNGWYENDRDMVNKGLDDAEIDWLSRCFLDSEGVRTLIDKWANDGLMGGV